MQASVCSGKGIQYWYQGNVIVENEIWHTIMTCQYQLERVPMVKILMKWKTIENFVQRLTISNCMVYYGRDAVTFYFPIFYMIFKMCKPKCVWVCISCVYKHKEYCIYTYGHIKTLTYEYIFMHKRKKIHKFKI